MAQDNEIYYPMGYVGISAGKKTYKVDAADVNEKRFGIVHINFKTLKRTPKNSYYFYKNLIENNSIPN